MAEEKICIKVILPLKLEWEPYYYAPEGTRRGDRVGVRFAGRQYVGVVSEVRVRPGADPTKIKEIDRIEQDLARISAEELRLWGFMSEYYLCTIGEVYKAAYPHGKVAEEIAAARMVKKREEIAAKRKAEAQARSARIESRLKERLSKEQAALAKARKDSVKEKLRDELAKTERELIAVHSFLSAGLEAATQTPVEDTAPQTPQAYRTITLTPAQEKAKKEIQEGFMAGKAVLLNGITGSGKTEIYINLARETLAEGKNVLYLSPEIALSGQLEERLRKDFGNALLCFHSAMTPAKKQEVIARIREGGYLALGTRSALFLPHRGLGLIIVDEEHDTSYKQDSPAPKYQGRDTAVMMGEIFGANVLLGSATPSMESLYNCSTGRYRMVELGERYFGSIDAHLMIIDTLAERKKNGMVGSFSRKLIEEIRKTLKAKGQVAILRSRRAYSPLVQCESCGDIPKCPHCNVSLSYHRITARLLCHQCGHSIAFSGCCPKCGGTLKALGTGTQKIEEEVQSLFPKARVARLDADSDGRVVVRDFSQGETDILVGTQLVTKGFDFERLSLVAVLLADSITGQQDFRADERALQLFSQFRGRCGRRGGNGTFVIQTSQPSHPVYTLLNGTREGRDIMSRMLEERRVFGYPPFTRLIKIIVKDVNAPRLEKLSADLAAALFSVLNPPMGNPSFQLAGPYPPPMDKISDEYIRHIRIHLPRDRSLVSRKTAISSAIKDFESTRNWRGHISIDVDPI